MLHHHGDCERDLGHIMSTMSLGGEKDLGPTITKWSLDCESGVEFAAFLKQMSEHWNETAVEALESSGKCYPIHMAYSKEQPVRPGQDLGIGRSDKVCNLPAFEADVQNRALSRSWRPINYFKLQVYFSHLHLRSCVQFFWSSL